MDIINWTYLDVQLKKINRKGPGRRKLWITYIRHCIKNNSFVIDPSVCDEDQERMKCMETMGIEGLKEKWGEQVNHVRENPVLHWSDTSIGNNFIKIHDILLSNTIPINQQ